LLDTDVLLDVATAREPFGPESKALLEWCYSSPRAGILAWHTIANLYYLLRAATNDRDARSFISGLLHFTEIASTAKDSVRRALSLNMSDFEDALQVSAGIAADVQFIVTRNTADYRGSPLPAITPHEFLRRFVSK
jgi:predicted nucleic acid-binding protein